MSEHISDWRNYLLWLIHGERWAQERELYDWISERNYKPNGKLTGPERQT